jgi:hypothetical protein
MCVRLNELGCLIVIASLVGCGASGRFSTAETEGVVLCEGKPVEGAMVYFSPLATESGSAINALAGKQGFSYTDSQGRFVISTYQPGKGDGAVVGKHRVRVGRGKAQCECAMNDTVDLMEVEIKAGETNTFELVLKKATAADKRKEERSRDDDEE